jgi:hypothetical protein
VLRVQVCIMDVRKYVCSGIVLHRIYKSMHIRTYVHTSGGKTFLQINIMILSIHMYIPSCIFWAPSTTPRAIYLYVMWGAVGLGADDGT